MNFIADGFEEIQKFFRQFTKVSTKPTPADFRRKTTTRGMSIVKFLPFATPKHLGTFQGVTPMKRRRKGVSRTHPNNGRK